MKKEPTPKLLMYKHEILRNMGLLETFCFVDLRIINRELYNLGPYLFRNTEGIRFLEMKNL